MDMKSKELHWDDYARNYSDRVERELCSFKQDAWVREIERHIGALAGTCILDVGTGPGFFPAALGKVGAFVTGVDSSEQMLAMAEARCRSRGISASFRKMDAEKLQFPDNCFHAVIARNLSYALSYPETAYREWLRVLRPKGKLLIYDANWFYFLSDVKEMERVNAYLEMYHCQFGQPHETYELEVQLFYEHIISRPLTHCARPAWDQAFFAQIPGYQVRVDYQVQETTNTIKEQFLNLPTPFFVVEVTKPSKTSTVL